MTIIIDTKEKKPFKLDGLKTIRKGLKVGDYSIEGFQDRVAIERKSAIDFYYTFGKPRNYQRFCVEMKQINKMEFGYLIVEESLENCISSIEKMKKGTVGLGNMALMNYRDFEKRFPNIEIDFYDTRNEADELTVQILKTIIDRIEGLQ